MALETLDLAGNGWKLQRGYTITPRYIVLEDERDSGVVQSVAVSQKPFRDLNLTYRATGRSAYEYFMSFTNRHVGPAGRFNFSLPEFVASPDKAAILTTVTEGSQGLRTIWVQYTWSNASGETLPSPSTSITVSANDLVVVSLPIFPPGVTQAVIYATEGAQGTEESQATITTRSWKQPDAALLTSTSFVPTTNAATETSTYRMVGQSVVRQAGLTYELSLTLSETDT